MTRARYITVACKSRTRWFDLDSERTPHQTNDAATRARPGTKRDGETRGNWASMGDAGSNPAGAPPLDCWTFDDDDPPTTTEEPPMSEARFIVSDVYEAMAKMPDNSVDLIVTSPPFLALRSYLPADHPDKAKEIGSEPTPAAFLSTLLALTREWRRILTPTGSLCVELGDTYSGSGGAGGDYGPVGLRNGQPEFDGSAARTRSNRPGQYGTDTGPQRRTITDAWPLDKSLCLIPSLFAGSLAYGRNLLQPDDLLEPWRVRNLIVWHRPNPPVGALGDKVRPSTSYVTVACTAKDRWFDLDSERTDFKPAHTDPLNVVGSTAMVNGQPRTPVRAMSSNPAGAPPLDCWLDAPDADVWTIPTAPYAGSHYATFPPALPRRLINLMCPRQVCVVCGEPRRRLVEATEEYAAVRGQRGFSPEDRRGNDSHLEASMRSNGRGGPTAQNTTLGWSDCGHNKWRRGIVCDPFCGSGTALQAASELGRDSIGIDLDRRNLELARQRLGMFLVEEDEVVA